ITHTASIVPADLPNQTYSIVRDTFGVLDGLGCNALPIELAEFNAEAKDDHVAVNWTTLSEQNNEHFLVLRASDGQNFEPIAELPGAGNSTVPIDYEHLDLRPLSDWSYYQLQQVDFNGETTFSEIEAVLFEPDAIKVNVFPNPIASDRKVWKVWLLGFERQEQITLTLTSSTGQLLHQQLVTSEDQSLLTEILPDKPLSTGIYHLHISWKNGRLSRKLVVK
ncbi:MAG: T9SS type A sorting domain-containing protein, partial [Bacteroidota bacterium]